MNASILTDCPAGRWSNTTGLTAFTQCTECIAGQYGNITGAINQNNACPYTCAAGRYGNVSGQTSSDSVTMCDFALLVAIAQAERISLNALLVGGAALPAD